MAHIMQQQDFVVSLAEGILVRTPIPSQNHAALRSGFAGYPANPRWNVSKFRAWKTGRHWRELLARQEIVVRESDSMLVPAQSLEQKREPSPGSRLQKIRNKVRLAPIEVS